MSKAHDNLVPGASASVLKAGEAGYPAILLARLGAAAPATLSALGNLDLLSLPKTALFCSARCPGSAILAAYDQAAIWRDSGRCIISGFHSPVEKECLQILLRGKQPIIICPARALPKRLPPEWQKPLADGRLQGKDVPLAAHRVCGKRRHGSMGPCANSSEPEDKPVRP